MAVTKPRDLFRVVHQQEALGSDSKSLHLFLTIHYDITLSGSHRISFQVKVVLFIVKKNDLTANVNTTSNRMTLLIL